MVKLRLRRVGKKKQPVYKIVAADSRASREGKFLEDIGSYNPLLNPMVIEVKEDRLFRWLKNGAQTTETVRSLLQRKGLWLKWSLMKKGADEAMINAELEKWQLLQSDKLRRDADRKARRRAAEKKKKSAGAEAPAPAAAAEAETTEAPAAESAAPAPAAEAPAA